MIKRYLCLNPEMLALSQARAVAHVPARLVFASGSGGSSSGGSSGGSGAESEKEKLNLQNLEDRLQEMEDEGKLSKKAVTEALNALKSGSDTIRMKVLKAARKVEDGSYDEGDFTARLPTTTEKKTEDTAEPGKENPAEKTAENEEEDKPSAEIIDIMKGTRLKSDEMLEKINAMEEAYKKREDIPEEMKTNFETLKKELTDINEMDRKNNSDFDGKVKAEAEKLLKQGKIGEEELKLIVERDYLDPDFAKGGEVETYDRENKKVVKKHVKGFDELTAKCTSKKSKEAVTRILALKKEQAEKNKKIEADLKERAKRFRRIMEQVGGAVMQRAAREKALKDMILSTGINIAPGQKLTYMALKTDKGGTLIPGTDEAEIKEVKFLDESAPLITVESKNPKTGEKVTDQYTLSNFNRMVDAMGATEKITTMKELENSINTTVYAGDTFTYLSQVQADTTLKIDEKTLKIEKIDSEKGQIVLSEDVKLAPQGTPNRYLTYGEFAKWYKRNEAMKEIKDIAQLRSELVAHNEYLNTLYKRKGGNFPPIEIEAGEVLKYDDNSGRTFVINEVGEDHVTLDNGEKLSFTGFLRWVKRNEVEKMTAESEAAQATAMSGDDAKKEKILEEKKKEIEARLEEAKKEAGTSDAHHSTHGHATPSVSYIGKLWADTRFMSLEGLYEMGKTIFELLKRKLKRNEHDRVGTVGSNMFTGIWPELGAEFKGVAQHAENEEVDHHAKHFRTMGIEVIRHELHTAPTRDILKAAVTVLCEKGAMRWDDPAFHTAMNKYAYGKLIDESGKVKPMWINESNYMYSIEKYMDSWWGNDTFREFRNKQDSSYNSVKSNFTDHAVRLEGDPDKNGGLRTALSKLLYDHMHGSYVNAAQYESYLHYAIEAGKLSFEDKLFFLIMGVGTSAPGDHGQTLLHIDRVSALEGKLLNNFPILDFLVSPFIPQVDESGKPILDEHGKQKMGKPNVDNFRDWIRKYMSKDFGGDAMSVSDPRALKPGKNMSQFVYKIAVWDEWMRTRLAKSARNASTWDHDDMDVHAAFLSETMVDQIVLKQGGATQQVSNPGLKNAIVGFNNFMKVKLEMLEANKNNPQESQKDMRNIVDLIKSFTKLDAILADRMYHGQNYARLSQSDYYSKALADADRTVKTHVDETHEFIRKMCETLDSKTEARYGLGEIWKKVLKERTSDKEGQTIAIKDIGIKMEGALNELKERGMDVSEIFLSHKGICKGIGHKAEKTADAEKENASEFEFRPYIDQQMVAKIEEYKDLNNKLGTSTMMTPEQIKAEESRRLKDIMNDYAAGKYAARPDDAKVLDNAIAVKRSELAEKMSGGAKKAA